MDAVFYKCETCGFAHQEPSYWSGHSPEKEIDMPHINLATKEMCNDNILKLVDKKI